MDGAARDVPELHAAEASDGPSAPATTHAPTVTAPKRPQALDWTVMVLYTAANLVFITAASFRIEGGRGGVFGMLPAQPAQATAGTPAPSAGGLGKLRLGNLLRVVATTLLMTAAICNAVADYLALRAASEAVAVAVSGQPALVPGREGATGAVGHEATEPPPKPEHTLDWPASYLQIGGTMLFTLGSSFIFGARGRTGLILAGSLCWLIGSSMAAISTCLLLALEIRRLKALGAVDAAHVHESRGLQQHRSLAKGLAVRTVVALRLLALRVGFVAHHGGPQLLVALLFTIASVIFTVASALYVSVRRPVFYDAEILLCTGSCLYLAGLLVNWASGVVVIIRHRRVPLSADTEESADVGQAGEAGAG